MKTFLKLEEVSSAGATPGCYLQVGDICDEDDDDWPECKTGNYDPVAGQCMCNEVTSYPCDTVEANSVLWAHLVSMLVSRLATARSVPIASRTLTATQTSATTDSSLKATLASVLAIYPIMPAARETLAALDQRGCSRHL